jgi:hypothetical protein
VAALDRDSDACHDGRPLVRFRRHRETTRATICGAVAIDLWLEIASRQRWIFILGCNNSGTTLLYRILAHHPSMHPVSNRYEGKSLTWQLPRAGKLGCGRLFTQRLDIFRWTEASDFVDVPHLAYDWLAGKTLDQEQFVVEKSPQHTVSARWLQKIFPDSYFIGIVRNGYAVSEGIRRRQGYSIERCAQHWNTVNRIMIEDSSYLKNFHLIPYEMLSISPNETLRKLAEFLGVDHTPFDQSIQQEWPVHNASGAPSTIQDFNGKSFKRLSGDDIGAIRATAEEMLDYFGYLDSPAQYATNA